MPQTDALFQLGIDLNSDSSTTQAEVLEFPNTVTARGADGAPGSHAADRRDHDESVVPGNVLDEDDRKDFFIERDGERFAGTHLIVDLVGASRLDDLPHIEQALKECVEVAGATLLHLHLHHFTPNGGVSGVAVLSESHISIHSWPEADYAALDIFMCGAAQPHLAIDVLREAFTPSDVKVVEHRRGSGMV